MSSNDVVNLLYAEFGQKEFLTRQIPDDAMARLAGMMAIKDAGQGRRIKVRQYISNLEGVEYATRSGEKVKLVVTRPANRRGKRRFRFIVPALREHKPVNTDGAAATPDIRTGYQVVLIQSGYGYAAVCPALRGCQSQGLDEAEALENIREAIAGWLKAEAHSAQRRASELVDDYRSAGYIVKLDTVLV